MRSLLCAVFACAAACADSPESYTSDEVVIIKPCSLPGDDCRAVADGHGPLTIIVSTPVPERVAPFDVQLRTSAGKWLSPTDPTSALTYKASLVATGQFSATLVPPVVPGLIRLDATLLAVSASPVYVALDAAPLGGIDLVATPVALVPSQANTIAVSAKVRGQKQGRPSEGTGVAFTVTSVLPTGAFAAILAASSVIDANDSATASLMSGPTVQSVVIKVVATPPTVAGFTALPSTSQSLGLSVAAP